MSPKKRKNEKMITEGEHVKKRKVISKNNRVEVQEQNKSFGNLNSFRNTVKSSEKTTLRNSKVAMKKVAKSGIKNTKVSTNKGIKRNSLDSKVQEDPGQDLKKSPKVKSNKKVVAKSKNIKQEDRKIEKSRDQDTTKSFKKEKPIMIIEPPASYFHGVVLIAGAGDSCQLGLGEDVTEVKRPQPIPELTDVTIHEAKAGGIGNIILTTNNSGVRQVWTWGSNDSGALGRTAKGFSQETKPGVIMELNNKNIIRISAGDSHMMALDADGTLYTWGSYRDPMGPIGFKSKKKAQSTPEIMQELIFKGKEKVSFVASGENTSYAITNSGLLYIWGDQKINSRTSPRDSYRLRLLTPTRVMCGKLKFDYIAAGSGYHILLVTKEKELYSMGLNNFGQLGYHKEPLKELTTFRPYIVQGLDGIKIIGAAVGQNHSLALSEDGKVYSWGRGDYGQLGHGNTDDVYLPLVISKLANLPNGEKVVNISAGMHHSIAVTSAGDIYAWGYGDQAQLGDGSDEDRNEPVKLNNSDPRSKLTGYHVVSADGGGQHSIYVAVRKEHVGLIRNRDQNEVVSDISIENDGKIITDEKEKKASSR